jgi:hypothetical protein
LELFSIPLFFIYKKKRDFQLFMRGGEMGTPAKHGEYTLPGVAVNHNVRPGKMCICTVK